MVSPCLIKRWYGWVSIHKFDNYSVRFNVDGNTVQCVACGHHRPLREHHEILESDWELPDTKDKELIDAEQRISKVD